MTVGNFEGLVTTGLRGLGSKTKRNLRHIGALRPVAPRRRGDALLTDS